MSNESAVERVVSQLIRLDEEDLLSAIHDALGQKAQRFSMEDAEQGQVAMDLRELQGHVMELMERWGM